MTTHSTTERLALVAGTLATTGALALLLQDAIRSHAWTLEHGLIPVLMGVQILTSHLAIAALRQWRAVSAIGFLVVAAVATWGVLYTSVGKQGRLAAEQASVAAETSIQRADIARRIKANADMLDGARARHAAECASGKGKRCDGIAATVRVYEDAVAGNRAELAKLPPAAEAVLADTMAGLIAALAGRDKAGIKAVLVLLEPFTYATIFELAALASFGFAFSGTSRRAPQNGGGTRGAASTSDGDRQQTDFGGWMDPAIVAGNLPDPPPPPKPRRRKPLPANVVTFSGQRPAKVAGNDPVLTALATVAGPVTNGRLARMMGVTDGEASKRVRAVADRLTIERRGREVLIALRRDGRVA